MRDAYVQGQINSSRVKIKNGDEVFDLTSLLLKNGNLTDDQIRSQVYTFLFAGHETTATALTWLLYFLGQFPEWREKIAHEFDAIGRVISPKTVKNLPITEAFLKETLRIAHVVDFYIPREVLVSVRYIHIFLYRNIYRK